MQHSLSLTVNGYSMCAETRIHLFMQVKDGACRYLKSMCFSICAMGLFVKLYVYVVSAQLQHS